MPNLVPRGRPVQTVFDLLGHHENDMTAALGWALSRHAGILLAFLPVVAPAMAVPASLVVNLRGPCRRLSVQGSLQVLLATNARGLARSNRTIA